MFIGPTGLLIKTRDSRQQMSLSYKQNNKELYVVVMALVSAVCVLSDAAGAESCSQTALMSRHEAPRGVPVMSRGVSGWRHVR